MEKEYRVRHSLGNGGNGAQFAYIRPAKECFNRDRRCHYRDTHKVISKWFTPVNYYKIDGFVIGSSSPENALKEYWRVCDKEKIKQNFKVELIEGGNNAKG